MWRGAITGKLTLVLHTAPCLPSKIRSLLEAWLWLLMSSCVGGPVSWTLWQIIFAASQHYCPLPLHPFLLLLSLPSIHPSDRALFCLKAFLPGPLPEPQLRCFQHFLDIPHHSFLLLPFLLLCGILLVFIAHVKEREVTLWYWKSKVSLLIRF